MTNASIPDLDLHLLGQGTHRRLHDQLGAQPAEGGCRFAVWAPSARAVHLVGDWDGWSGEVEMHPQGSSGVWSVWLDHIGVGATYRFRITTPSGDRFDKSDPIAAGYHGAPSIASVVADLDYAWGDADWMATRGTNAAGSTRRCRSTRCTSARGGAPSATANGSRPTASWPTRSPITCLAHGFTHVELLPVMEHPFYGSWGYQTTGYFAPTSRYGTPQDFMSLVDHLHQAGIGVILDWVPSHFPTDEPRAGALRRHPPLRARRPAPGLPPRLETRRSSTTAATRCATFLLSSALFWLDQYHIDGLRVDAVASMLYLDYSRKEGEWIPNQYGGRENLEAIAFLRQTQRGGLRRVPRRRHHRRGVDRLADGHPPDLPRRARLRLQVEHGLDARHARSTSSGTRSTGATTTTS